ncbi:hypothetical protein N7539_003552 [Penicillium diatomitis]|uniref:PHD-type domain-containing protein n=1 Tax=Penicillium diatomitis TaxID=2819901 RepID=A0A9W9XDD3_9EURO|nr:uncharacterized protein N7539_003552 [Penicillium diatomitis]KAJ5488662.1 hypothetical protein N7539_003552 [Penicillium diatomitis]
MAVLTRSKRQASEPTEKKRAEPKTISRLLKKTLRSTRNTSPRTGDALVDENRASPAPRRDHGTRASTNADFPPRVETIYGITMRPIGQYPTAAEYKSAGLLPLPSKGSFQRVFKFMTRGNKGPSEAVVTDRSAPISPVAEQSIVADLQGSKSVSEPLPGDSEHDLVEAVPVFEATGSQTAGTSLSPLEAAVAMLGHDLASDLAAPGSLSSAPLGSLSSGPLLASTTRRQTDPASPNGVNNADMLPALVPQPDVPVARDFLAILESLPAPTSDHYDVAQLKQVLASSITQAREAGQDEIAVDLLYYWSGTAGDDFRLSLIHNLGLKEVDADLLLAFKTLMRRSNEEAFEWYRAHLASHAASMTQQGPGSDSGRSSAQPAEADRAAQAYKTADIYRDTSGPRLEDLFNAGKTNTAPLKRPKKPCPVNEKSFKRRREWECDPSLEQTLRLKRARLMKNSTPDPSQVRAERSSIRPQKDEPILIEQSLRQVTPSESTGVEEVANSVELPSEPVPVPTRGQRGGRGRGRGRGRGGRAVSTRSQRTQDAQEQTEQQVGSHPTVALAPPPQVLGKRSRELSLDTTVSAESELSNECYSDRENEWHEGFGRRQMPNSIAPPENSDNCYECDQVGNLLCCDTCESAFHFECLRPAEDPKHPPQGEWYCPRCGVRNPITTTIAHGRHKKRKTEFNLPDEIKDYFTGVETGHMSDAPNPQDIKNMRFYKSAPHIPRLTKPPRAGTRATPAYDDPNLLKMSDNGQHVLPDELVVTKMVNGKMQERRPRRPKNATVASVDVEPAPYEDVNETTFDDDFREKRHLLPAGDLVLDFISAVRHDSSRRRQDYFTELTRTCMDYARGLVEERLAQSSNQSADEITASIAPKIKEAIGNLQSGQASKDQYDAAVALMGFAKGDDSSASVDGSSS